jgi:c-di-GMP-related signal transduction protein
LAATRARFMELAVEELESQDKGLAGRAFLGGLLSLMGVLLGQSVETVLGQLDVEHDIRDAVLKHEGLLGSLLLIAESWEREDDSVCAEMCKRIAGLTPAKINQAQLAAFAWFNNLGNATP